MKTTNKYINLSLKGFLEIADAYTLPTVDGSFGHIMITDGVGGVTWADPGTLALDTDDVTEASNLYFTDERVDDRVSALIQDGTGIAWTYVDGSNTFTGNVTLSPFDTGDLAEGVNLYFTDERVDDRVAVLIQNGTGISWTYADGAGTLTPAITLSPFDTDDLAEGAINKYATNENIDDRVSVLIQNGTGLTWTYNDPANTFTGNVSLASFDTGDLIEGSNLYFTDERVDDRVSALMTDTATITWTYNDIANTLEANAAAQPIEVELNGVLQSTRGTINLIEGTNVSITIVDNGGTDATDITINSTATGGGSGTLYEILNDGVVIGDSDTAQLNFSSKFSAVESPDQYVTIDIVMLLEELADVAVLSPIADGDVLQYNSGLGLWENVSLDGLHTLDELGDVTLTSPILDGEALIYNSGTGQWENGIVASAFTELSDVTLTSPITDGQVVSYNIGTGQWENIDNTISALLDVDDVSAPNDGDILRFNDISGLWETARYLTSIKNNNIVIGNEYPEEINFSSKFTVSQDGGTPSKIDVEIGNLSISDLVDVLVISGVSAGDTLIYNDTLGIWETGLPLVSLQEAYEDTLFGRVTTNLLRESIKFKRGTALDTDNVVEIENGSEVSVFQITGEGKITSGEWNGTEVDIAYGGTGETTAQAAIDSLTQVSGAIIGHVLTKDGFGNASWQPVGAPAITIIKFDGVQANTGAPTLDFDSNYFIHTESPTDEFNITFDETGIDHDALFNYVPNQHVDHTTVLMNAGIGLAGGGTIGATRTFDLDLNDLTTVTSITSADLIPFYDTVGGQTVNITQTDFVAGLGLVNGSGTAGYVSRWITGTQLGTGSIRDDGTNVAISNGGTLAPAAGLGLRVKYDEAYSIFVENSATTVNPIGVVIANNGVTANTKTGMWIDVTNGTGSQYGLRITDGSQADGRFLKSNASGQANWADITEADITDLQSYALSSVTITAGIGLTGGGDLTTNRTFDLDIPGLPTLTDAGVLASGDTFAVYNLSATAHEEVTLTQLATGIQTELSLVDGSGTNNYIAKWTPDTNTLGDSQIQDNGTTMAIGDASLNASYFINIEKNNRTGINMVNTYNGALPSWGIQISNVSVDTGSDKVGLLATVGNNPNLNTGVKGYAYTAATVNIGGTFQATGATTNYSVELLDGTETTGTWLKNISNGRAQWGNITSADITDLGTTLAAYLPLAGGTMTGDILFSGTATLNENGGGGQITLGQDSTNYVAITTDNGTYATPYLWASATSGIELYGGTNPVHIQSDQIRFYQGGTSIFGEFDLSLLTSPGKVYKLQDTDGHIALTNLYSAATTSATPAEIFIDGVASTRLAITSNSAVGFKGTIVAIDNTTNATKFWKVEGLIKNIAGTTSMVGSATKIVVAEDAGATAFDVTITADDTNDSLKIEVIGHATNTVDWTAKVEVTEVIK